MVSQNLLLINIQSLIIFKTKEVVQSLETLRKIAEMNGASDNAYRSLHEFETLCLKQSEEEASKQSNILLKTNPYLAFYQLTIH